jgi:hypothetical protein
MGMTGQTDPAQMSRMMENCNRMMESMRREGGTGPAAPAAPTPHG